MNVFGGLALALTVLIIAAIGFTWGFVVGVRVADAPLPRWILTLLGYPRIVDSQRKPLIRR